MNPNNPCAGCAFNPGAAANLEPNNRVRSEICALAGLPFMCHHGLQWDKPLGIYRGIAFDTAGSTIPARVCAGWKSRVRELNLLGYFRNNRQARRHYGTMALKSLNLALSQDIPQPERDFHWSRLRMLMQKLVKKNITLAGWL